MNITGKRNDRPGWRDDPQRPGIERYWTGSAWDDTIAPRAKPGMSAQQAWGLVLAAIVVAGVAYFLWMAANG